MEPVWLLNTVLDDRFPHPAAMYCNIWSRYGFLILHTCALINNMFSCPCISSYACYNKIKPNGFLSISATAHQHYRSICLYVQYLFIRPVVSPSELIITINSRLLIIIPIPQSIRRLRTPSGPVYLNAIVICLYSNGNWYIIQPGNIYWFTTICLFQFVVMHN